MHIHSMLSVLINSIITLVCMALGYFKVIYLDNVNLFNSVMMVVIGDWIFGTMVSIQRGKWETRKALRVIYYFAAYFVIVFIVLSIQKGNPNAFFLDEAIILPILIFQMISMLKNASILGIIPKGLLSEILEKIDSYKHKENDVQEN